MHPARLEDECEMCSVSATRSNEWMNVHIAFHGGVEWGFVLP